MLWNYDGGGRLHNTMNVPNTTDFIPRMVNFMLSEFHLSTKQKSKQERISLGLEPESVPRTQDGR